MSNLLQKASIVTTPTAYGVGVLNSIKPAYALGENLVINGDFLTNTIEGWDNWDNLTLPQNTSQNNGYGILDSTNGTCDARQNVTVVAGYKYKITATMYQDSGANGKFYMSDGANYSYAFGHFQATETETTFSKVVQPTQTTIRLYAYNTGNNKAYYKNIKIEQVTDADFDFTRTSSAVRVNPDYLIETVSINSANLVQNGDFSELGSELITNGDFSNGGANWSYNINHWSFNNERADCNGTQTGLSYLNQSGAIVSGKIYEVTYEVTSITAGEIRVFVGDVSGLARTTVGVYTEYITATSTNFWLRASSTFVGSIDNVSVKQVDPNNYWITEAGWTISNSEANRTNTGTYTALQQNVLTSGKTYDFSIELKSVTSGSIFGIRLGTNYILQGVLSSAGVYTARGVANASTLSIMGDPSFEGSIDNISLIEIQDNGVPRLDYTNGTASILLEPQSTNLITDYLGASWSTFNGASITANDSTSPEGVVNATNIIYGGTSNELIQKSSIAITSGVTYTISGYFKLKSGSLSSSNNDFKGLDGLNGGGIGSSTFNTINNTWKRFSFSSTSSTTSGRIQIKCEDSVEILIYGLQLEEQSYPTSLIPTDGSTVTRAAETLNNAANSDLFNPNEGVLYIETAALANDGTTRQISLSDGSSSQNKVSILYLSTTNEIKAFIRGGGAVSMNLSFTLNNALGFNKIALKYKVDDFALWVNGTEVLTDNSGAIPTGLSDLSFDDADGTQPFYGKCKMVAVFKEALSDTELACLTSTNNREIFLNYYYRMQYVGANTEALSCAEQTFNI